MHIQARLPLLYPMFVDAFGPSRISWHSTKIYNRNCNFIVASSRPDRSTFGRCKASMIESPSAWTSTFHEMKNFLSKLPLAVLLISAATFSLPEKSSAVLSNEQRVVAEAWSIVDATFVDRTFNNNDWLKIRQTLVKRQYNSRDEVQTLVMK